MISAVGLAVPCPSICNWNRLADVAFCHIVGVEHRTCPHHSLGLLLFEFNRQLLQILDLTLFQFQLYLWFFEKCGPYLCQRFTSVSQHVAFTMLVPERPDSGRRTEEELIVVEYHLARYAVARKEPGLGLLAMC